MGKAEKSKMHNKLKTKRKTKDLDEIHEDMKPKKAVKLLKQDVDYDMPGNAQFYCIQCARYFVNEQALKEHTRSKVHKKRLKELKTTPYSIEESERAGGMGSYKAPQKNLPVHTPDIPGDMELTEDAGS